MLPAGVAVWPGSATQVASWVWVPSRLTTTIASLSWWAYTGARHTQLRSMNVPQCWLLSETVEASSLVPTWDIVSADTLACGGGDVGEWLATPTNRPIASTAAAADVADHVIRRERRRCRRTANNNDGSKFGAGAEGSALVARVDRGHRATIELGQQSRHAAELSHGLATQRADAQVRLELKSIGR